MTIAAVVVTYKDLHFLKHCISGIRNQNRQVDQIIVINNGGMDESAEWLKEQNDILTINQKNTGGAGGFYSGMHKAFSLNFDWIWCLDQDIEVNNMTLSSLINSNAAKFNDIGFLSSLVLYNENEIAYTNVPLLPVAEKLIYSLAYEKVLPILCSSFGSVLFSRRSVFESGFPIQDFFIWGDDSEYTIRMIQLGFRGFLVLDSVVYHRSISNNPDPFLTMQFNKHRSGIGIRNKIYLTRLRNEVLYNSKLRGLLASINYLARIFKYRVKHRKLKVFYEVVFILKYFSLGIFYNPRKFLNPEIINNLQNKIKLN